MIVDYMEEIWAQLHEMAEPSGGEIKTAKFVEDQLREMGYTDIITGVGGGHGIIASYDSGNEGEVLGIRSELDALSYESNGKLEYIHSCGHDAHMSILLGVAKDLMENKINKGKFRLIFQPAEETMSGALEILKSNELDDLTHILGMHIRPVQDCALGEACAGILHSATAPTKIKVKGLAAHGARPHLGKNAVEAAVEIVNALNSIRVDPNVSHSIKTTQINTAGKSGNVIPEEVTMYVDSRSRTNEVLEEIIKKIEDAVEYGAKANGCEAEAKIFACPAAEYDEEMLELNKKAIKEVLGEDGLIPNIVNPGSDDFHNYGIKLGIKSGFIGLGAGATPGLHDRDMEFDHKAMEYGQAIISKVVGYLLKD